MNNIIINNSKVVINTPTKLPSKRKHFKKVLRIGKLRLYITWNYRLKNRQQRDLEHNHDICNVKKMLWEKNDCHCHICGKKIDKYCHSQLHHVLPWWRFPQFETDERNLMILCHDCHKSIHTDPFLDCKMQKAKADELGINLKEYYDV